MEEVKIIGDLKITKETGGNPGHGSFWHKLTCSCVKDSSETIMCSPPITTFSTYYACGYWEKERHETVKDAR